jgi:hypothetical protein
VEVTPLTKRAFRSTRGLTGGLVCLLISVAATLGLSACGAPSYTYVADSSAQTYYKVPLGWHQISQQSLNAALQAVFGSSAGVWSRAYDGSSSPSGSNILAASLGQPFAFSEVGTLSSAGSNELSYNMLRDFVLPVTSTARSQAAQQGNFPLTNFKPLRDQTITGHNGVHGVRETFDYTYPGGAVSTFDEDVLTNADQTQVYFLMVHCSDSCYSHNENNINTVMSSFTVGSPT